MQNNFNYLKSNYDYIMKYLNYHPEFRNYYASWIQQVEKLMKEYGDELDKPEVSFSVSTYTQLSF